MTGFQQIGQPDENVGQDPGPEKFGAFVCSITGDHDQFKAVESYNASSKYV